MRPKKASNKYPYKTPKQEMLAIFNCEWRLNEKETRLAKKRMRKPIPSILGGRENIFYKKFAELNRSRK